MTKRKLVAWQSENGNFSSEHFQKKIPTQSLFAKEKHKHWNTPWKGNTEGNWSLEQRSGSRSSPCWLHHVSLDVVLEESRPVLVLAFLHPVAVDSERTAIDELAKRTNAVRVLFDVVEVDLRWVEVHCLDSIHRYYNKCASLRKQTETIGTFTSNTIDLHFKCKKTNPSHL